jgi:hypothetical protein
MAVEKFMGWAMVPEIQQDLAGPCDSTNGICDVPRNAMNFSITGLTSIVLVC